MAFTLSDIPTFELRNGVRVDLTDDERNSMLTAWNEDETRIQDDKMVRLRHERNAKLAETDWTQSRDVTLTNDAAWQTYRQALRDITDTYSDLDSVVWPTKPE